MAVPGVYEQALTPSLPASVICPLAGGGGEWGGSWQPPGLLSPSQL